LTAPGAFITPGGELATIVPVGARRVAFLFVSTSQASQLRIGMQALLSPRVAESRATGLLEGRIVHIGDFPATPDRLTLLLGPVLASQLASGPPVDEVEVELAPDRSTPSGYAWTTGAGPASVSVGTRVSGRVRLKQQSPLSYVF
jgi:HlyD family secretion protein